MHQLHNDCLIEIIKHLDEVALRSCQYINNRWCKVSTPILWKDVRNYKTLFACLPQESKDVLHANGIIVPTPTLKPPLFHYVSFVKNFSVHDTITQIDYYLKMTDDKKALVLQEIVKMIMNHTYLKKLEMDDKYLTNLECPGTVECLKNLSGFACQSNFKTLYPINTVCQNIERLKVIFDRVTSEELAEFISDQTNIKYLKLTKYEGSFPRNHSIKDSTKLVPAFTKLSNTIIKLKIEGRRWLTNELTFMENFQNLQVLVLMLKDHNLFDFKILYHVIFPKLQSLTIKQSRLNNEYINQFLKNHGRSLKELYLHNSNPSFNSTIEQFLPNLKHLLTRFENDEVETLKEILNGCQELKCLSVLCDDDKNYLDESRILRVVASRSPQGFHELRLCFMLRDREQIFFTEDLRTIFTTWANRASRQSFGVTIMGIDDSKIERENLDTIRRFLETGILSKFEFK